MHLRLKLNHKSKIKLTKLKEESMSKIQPCINTLLRFAEEERNKKLSLIYKNNATYKIYYIFYFTKNYARNESEMDKIDFIGKKITIVACFFKRLIYTRFYKHIFKFTL